MAIRCRHEIDAASCAEEMLGRASADASNVGDAMRQQQLVPAMEMEDCEAELLEAATASLQNGNNALALCERFAVLYFVFFFIDVWLFFSFSPLVIRKTLTTKLNRYTEPLSAG